MEKTGMESVEIDPHKYIQVVFEKGTKEKEWR